MTKEGDDECGRNIHRDTNTVKWFSCYSNNESAVLKGMFDVPAVCLF